MTDHPLPAVPGETPLPWDSEDDPETPAAPGAPALERRRQRHDAFTDARKRAFLEALIKTGCLLDACRATGISAKTAYRHQESDPRFAAHCRTALRMSATPLELTAWTRAVEGVEREFACGGQVYTRRLYSDSLLRLLLQGSNPKKYGQRPGFTRKQLAKAERRQIRREVEAEARLGGKFARRRSPEEVKQSILRKLTAIYRHEEPKKLAAGWTKTADGDWVPPGYAWVGLPEGWRPPEPFDDGAAPPGDSV
jgi:hypothetical protein